MSYDDTQTDAGTEQPVAPPDVYLIGEAGFDPAFPKVGHPVVYYWSEANRGGQHQSDYHARVSWKDPDGNIIDDVSVDCTPLATGDSAYRSIELSAPQQATIGYSIELWVDVDHHSSFSEGYNYAYHNVDASEDW
jgi:hypothetical protein